MAPQLQLPMAESPLDHLNAMAEVAAAIPLDLRVGADSVNQRPDRPSAELDAVDGLPMEEVATTATTASATTTPRRLAMLAAVEEAAAEMVTAEVAATHLNAHLIPVGSSARRRTK